jgi:hypothetical protein
MADITGWGRGTWGEATWGEPIPVDVTGVNLTSNIGTVSIALSITVEVTGNILTGALGDSTITGTANIDVTGISLNSDIGNVTITADANVNVTGNSLTGTLGDSTITGTANVNVTGQELTSTVGSVTTKADANVNVTGVSASILLPIPLAFTGFGDAQISTAQSKFGGASLLLDGTGDYVESEGTYNFAGDPFTIDMWVRPTSGTQDAVFFDSRDSLSNNAIALRQASDNLLVLRANGTLFNINNVFSANTWVHIAVTRGSPFGNTYSVFVNGVKQDSTLFGVTATAANIHIGSDFNGSNNWEGYIDELRVADVDEYGGTDFTPPTSAYTADGNIPILLHFDGANGSTTFTNSGIVNSVTITADANVTLTGISLVSNVGNSDAFADANVEVTGIQLNSTAGSVITKADANVNVTGVELSTNIGSVIATAWSQVNPGVVNSWTEVNPGVSTSWTEVNPNINNTWTEVDKAA